jgi:Zn-dependent protease with chaperone function
MRAVILVAAGGILLVIARTGWTTLRLGRGLRGLPRAERRLELERAGVECLAAKAPAAFCAGALRPRVYVTDSLVDLLSPSALAAVIAHEQAHARRRDPLRRTVLAALSDLLLKAPWVLWLRQLHGERAEISADRAAATLVGPNAVADALTSLAMGGDEASADLDADSMPALGLRRIAASLVATAAVAVMLLCLAQAAVLLGSGRIPHL